MATLLDRLVKTNLASDDSGVPIHAFSASVFRNALSGDVTRAQIISWFAIAPAEEAELDDILALPSGSASAKIQACLEIWQVLLLGETATITKTEAKTMLGLSLG